MKNNCRISSSQLIFLILTIAVFLLLTGCSSNGDQSTTEDAVMAENEFKLKSNTQMEYEDLRIGAGNFRKEECTDQQGSKSKCLTAGLWIYYRNDSNLDQQVRVQPGQVITVGVYQIQINDVVDDSNTSFVRLAITKP
jgi:hypothetical protein